MAEDVLVVLRVHTVIERFGHLGVVGQEMRNIKILSEDFFFGVIQILAPLNGHIFCLKNFNGFVVSHSRVRIVRVPCNESEISFQIGKFILTFIQQGSCDVSNHTFTVGHDVVVGGPSHFHLSMPKFGQVASSSRFLCSEGRCDGVETLKRRHGCFGIELPGLREIGLLSKIRDLKQR